MTKSMTAFARVESGNVAWEVRSVNHRYMDATFKIPERYRGFEPGLRSILRQQLDRGKLECLLRVDQEPSESSQLAVNEDILKQLLGAVNKTRNVMKETMLNSNESSLNPLDVLRWPGVLQEDQHDQSELEQRIKNTFEKALSSLLEMRKREGAELKKIILAKLTEVEEIVGLVREEAPKIILRQKQKLMARLEDLRGDIDNNRLEQELVYLAQKSDIVEELDRLNTHAEEVRTALKQKGAVGRRLDFLMQELNREANTLSSKATAANTSIQAVDLKVIIEQMREQVQNIE